MKEIGGITPEGQPTMPRFDECSERANASDGTSSGTSCAAPALQAPEYPMRCTGRCAGGAG